MLRLIDLYTHYRVRAYHGALAALDAGFCVPHRNFERDVTFFPFARGGWISAVSGESAHGNLVSVAGVYCAEHIALVLVRVRGKRRQKLDSAGRHFWNSYLKQARECLIYRAQVLPNNLFALLTIGVTNRLANCCDGVFPRRSEERRVGKECR